MTLILIQDLKTPKKSTERKAKMFQYDLEKKENFRDLRVFDFPLYLRLKTRKSRKFLFYFKF